MSKPCMHDNPMPVPRSGAGRVLVGEVGARPRARRVMTNRIFAESGCWTTRGWHGPSIRKKTMIHSDVRSNEA